MQWWVTGCLLCLTPFILLGMIALVSLLAAEVEDKLLQKYGINTEASITSSLEYTGDGFHQGDPCFQGEYTFTDLRGRSYAFKFSRECYDIYDLVDYWKETRGMYALGTRIHVRYFKWRPEIHTIKFPHPETEKHMINWLDGPLSKKEI